MSTFLLDVNVLIALIDQRHVFHEAAHGWFGRRHVSWATCPLTELALLRIVGHPAYPNFPGSPAAVANVFSDLCRSEHHQFWPDDISVLNNRRLNADRLLVSSQLTDSYLLALASAKNGLLATFDRHIVTDAVTGGREALHVIS